MKKYKLTFKKSLTDSKPESITVEAENRFGADVLATTHIKENYTGRYAHSVRINYQSKPIEIIYLLI